jgi:hypothetical protein
MSRTAPGANAQEIARLYFALPLPGKLQFLDMSVHYYQYLFVRAELYLRYCKKISTKLSGEEKETLNEACERVANNLKVIGVPSWDEITLIQALYGIAILGADCDIIEKIVVKHRNI